MIRSKLHPLLTIAILLLLIGCKAKTVYVPVETVRTQYNEKYLRDSVYLHDSVFIDRFTKGDTVFLTKEKYKYLYRDKLVRDSIFITDSIQVPYAIKGDAQYINQLYRWQYLLMILGAICIGMLAYKIYRYIRIGS